jgi:hypothetical protein
MLLYPIQEARKTMLKKLGTRLGMEEGCHPERAETLPCLHEALLPLALPSLCEARAACNIPREHEQVTGAAASAIQKSGNSPPCSELLDKQKCLVGATVKWRIPGKVAAERTAQSPVHDASRCRWYKAVHRDVYRGAQSPDVSLTRDGTGLSAAMLKYLFSNTISLMQNALLMVLSSKAS